MPSEFYAKLGIYSKVLNPDQVTSILGIACDKGYERGDIIRPHGIVHRKENQWFIYSRISIEAPLEGHVNDLLKRVSSIKDKIKNIADQPDNDVELSCVIHSKEETPLFFTKEVIYALCEMGASIDVDLYYWTHKPKDNDKIDRNPD
jgi:hypothetical protein